MFLLKGQIRFLVCQPASLPDHSCKSRDQMKHTMHFMSTLHVVCMSVFAFPFIFNYMVVFFFMQENHTEAFIFHIDTFLRGAYLGSTKLFEALQEGVDTCSCTIK